MLRNSNFYSKGGVGVGSSLFELPSATKNQFALDRRIVTRARLIEDNAMHWHDFIQLWYSPKNSYVHNLLQCDLTIASGGFCIVPPYHHHDLSPHSLGDFEVSCLDLSPDFVKDILPDPLDHSLFFNPLLSLRTGLPVFYLNGANKYEMELLLDDIFTEYHKDPQKFFVIHKNKIACLLNLIVLHIRSSGYTSISTNRLQLLEKYREPVSRACSYINSNYKRKISVNEVCRKAYLSKSVFCRVFKEVTGNTLLEYISHIRKTHACIMLTDTDIPVHEIACESGFSSKSQFHDLFKFYQGETPNEFRRKTREIKDM